MKSLLLKCFLVCVVLFLGVALVPHLTAETTANTNQIIIDVLPKYFPIAATATQRASSFVISATPVTPTQYCAFLNAVAATGDPHNLYHYQWNDSRYPNLSCIKKSGDITKGFIYSVIGGVKILPFVPKNVDPDTGVETVADEAKIPNGETALKYVTLADAARFCNWMSHNQPIGPEGDDTTETGSYIIKETEEVVDPKTKQTVIKELQQVYKRVTRTDKATWRLPNQNELATVSADSMLDPGEIFWSWTDDVAQLRSITTRDPITHVATVKEMNYSGYHRVKNYPTTTMEKNSFCMYQNISNISTGFYLVLQTQ